MLALKKSRHITAAAAGAAFSIFTCFATAAPSPPLSQSDLRAIYKALGLKTSGRELIDACDEIVQPEIETVDLNADGKLEAFVTVAGPCYGATGDELSLFIRDSKGRWQLNLGFPASGYVLLGTKNMGYPDIEIGGPGLCFPIWRWNGSKYDIYKRCE